MLASVGHWWEGRWSGGLHPPSTCLWGVHLPPSPASPSPTPPEASFRAAAAAGESVTAQTQGSPLSCRNASQSPSRLKAHYYKEWNTFFFFSLSLFLFRLARWVSNQDPLSFCGVVVELVVAVLVGQDSCILVWDISFFPDLDEKATPAPSATLKCGKVRGIKRKRELAPLWFFTVSFLIHNT